MEAMDMKSDLGPEFLPGQSGISHQEQLSLWQHDSYLSPEPDSGVVSGALSVATHMADDVLYDWETNSNGLGSQFSGSAMDQAMANVGSHQPASRPRSTICGQTIDEHMEISSEYLGHNEGMCLDNSNPHSIVPNLVKLLNSEHPDIVLDAAMMISKLSNEDRVHLLVESPQMIRSTVKALTNSNDPQITKHVGGALEKFSRLRKGRQEIFKADGVPALVKLLSSPLENVVFYAITTLHNLLLNQEGTKNAVKNAGGLQKMVSLLQRNNQKFLTIVTDCLQILAFGDQSAKLTILASRGVSELLRILRAFDYEKLLWTTTRVLKVLSVCSSNKPAIIEGGGVEALTQHLGSSSSRLVINCLFTIRNLSDATLPQENMEELLHRLVRLLPSQNADIVTLVAGALSNLTCNNQRNKSIVFRSGGCEALVKTVFEAGDKEDITEPAMCTLRHLTCRYPEAELAQQIIRRAGGVQIISKILPASSWLLKKAIIGLIRNLALHQENHVLFREQNLMHMMMETLQRASNDLTTGLQMSQTPPVYKGVKIVDIIDAILGALHILVRDPANRAQMRSMRAAPLFVRLFYAEIENITRLAALVLCELASDREGVYHLNAENLQVPLEELTRTSHNQATVNFAAHVINEINNRLMTVESQSAFGFG